MCFRRESFHVAGKVALPRIKSPADIPTLFFCQSPQLLASFLFNFKPVAHRSFPNHRLTQMTAEKPVRFAVALRSGF